jgi:tetratricopeptide (TPR) repeat protein
LKAWLDRDGLQFLVICVLICLLFAVFFPAIGHDFLNYDDPAYVTANPHVQAGLTWRSINWAFSSSGGTGNWHPLTWLSHMADVEIFGLKAWGHHLTNVLLHIANSVLVFVLLRTITGATRLSLLVAALFGLHPLHVESVAWVAERKDVLSTLFWLLAIWAYAAFVRASPAQKSRASAFYALSIILFCLGLMAKPMLVSLPFLLLLLDYWPFRRLDWSCARQRLLEKAPFLAIALLMSVVTFLVQKSDGMIAPAPLSLPARVANALVSYLMYLGKLFWPSNLAIFYPHPGRWPAALVVLSFVVVAGITVAVVILAPKHPYLPVGWFWFLGTLIPVIGLVQVGEQSMADRYSYFPLIGMFVMVTWGMHDLLKRRRYGPSIAGILGMTVVAACVPVTVRQLGFWKDSETVFRHAIAVTANNWMALDNLGSALLKQGRLDEAKVQLQNALEINPGDPTAHNNLGLVLLRQGRFDQAIQELRITLALKPDDILSRINLGAVLLNQGNHADAIREFQEASKRDPMNVGAHNNLAVALLAVGRAQEAVDEYHQALRLNPADAGAHKNLGLALSQMGNFDEAIAQFQEALRLKPDFTQAYLSLGDVLAKKGSFEEAVKQYAKALQLEPTSAVGHFQLALSLIQLDKQGEAVQQLNEVLKLNPNFPQAEQLLRALAVSKAP